MDDVDIVIKRYFAPSTEQAWHIGICPMGTADVFEIPYRHYWEFQKFQELLPRSSPLSVLELGCGAGRWALSLASFAEQYTGVDLVSSQLDIAKQSLPTNAASKVRFVQADILAFEPSAGERYSVIYTSGVLQYLQDDEILLLVEKLKKHLAPNGVWIERSTVVTEQERVVRDSPEYFSIYRKPGELIELFRQHDFCCQTRSRSYRYLRFPGLWRIPGLRQGVQWGMRRAPYITFRCMERLSALAEQLCGEAGREQDGVMYSHDFFLFTEVQR